MDRTKDPGWSLQKRRAHTLERSAAYVRLVIAVVAIPLILIFEQEHLLTLTLLIIGLALFSLFARYLAKRYPNSVVAANVSWPVALGIALAVIAITGGLHSPMWLFLILPMLGAAARFRGIYSASAVFISVVGGSVIIFATPNVGHQEGILAVFSLALIGLSLWMFGERDMQLHEESVLDPLTELFNRHHLNGRLTELDVTMRRIGGQTAIIVADLDFFKKINDKYGHARGDAVLRDVAYILRENIRMNDVAFRAGGEEFVMILPGTDEDTAYGVGERVRKAVEMGRPGDLQVTLSCGVAAARAADGIDMNSLMQTADGALYVAKRNGRNRICKSSDEAGVASEPNLKVA